MKTSDKFLKLYIPDLEASGKEFSEAITLTGTKIETYEKLDKNLDKIVVGKIEKIEKHPDADKLVICKVNIGSEVTQIVTGAQNVYEGMLVPAVLPGGKVAASAHDNDEHPDGIPIKDGKLRGVESHGMLCSIDELGRPADLYPGTDGIYDMSKLSCKPGDNAIEVLGLTDCLYDFEITSNRVDCYSVLGIAREVAATFDKKLNLPKTTFKVSFKDDKYINLEIKNPELCKAFYTRFVKNIKIAESPEWMKNALCAVGIRPINNIVDITNFVMMECGQPLHAYDYDTIRGKKIVVKVASDNDKFVTLDGNERTLDSTILTICDNDGAIGLAGIMGGENSMITNNCKNLLLESATFVGANIRKSSKKLGLRTEASNLFEKGLTEKGARFAIDRACALIEELGAGEICENIIYIDKSENNKNENITISAKKVNSLLGTDISVARMKTILDKIELYTTIDGDNLKIEVPYFRQDIKTFADIAEEVIRFEGYDKAKETLPHISLSSNLPTKEELIEKYVKEVSLYNGFSEAMNYSFESAKVYDKLCYKEDAKERNYIKIKNPLGEEFEVMRTQLINGMLKSLSTNYNRRNKEARLFEYANIYLPLDKEINALPDERKTLTLAGYGENLDYYVMKGVAEEILSKTKVRGKISFEKCDSIPYMHPGRTANIVVNRETIGYLGEVHEKILKNYEIGTKTYVLEFDIKNLSEKSDLSTKFKEISKFPESTRDLSMLVPKEIEAAKIVDIFSKIGGRLLKNIELFDIYEGNQVKDGFKSLAYSLSFGLIDRSLKDTEVDEIIEKIIAKLSEIGIELRK